MNILLAGLAAKDRQFLQSVLAGEHHNVWVAGDGNAALALLKRTPINAVFANPRLRRIDGYRLCRALRQNAASSPLAFIFYASDADPAGAERFCSALGADAYLPKPATAAAILTALHQACQHQAQLALDQTPPTANTTDATQLPERRQVSSACNTATSVRVSEQRYRRLVESNMIGVMIASRDGGIYEINDRLLEILGYSRDQFQAAGLRWDRMTPPEWIEQDQRMVLLLRAEGMCQAYDKEYFRKDGSRVAVQLKVARLAEVDDQYLCLVTDISERKRAEAALQEREHLLSESQRVAGVGSWQIDLPSYQVHWTTESYRIFEIAPESSTPSFDFIVALLHPDDRDPARRWVAACAKGGQPPELEFRFIRADGGLKYLRARGELIHNTSGVPVCTIGTVQDVTAQKQTEQELLRLSSQLVRAQDQERRRLARELHDSTAQVIASLSMNLAVLLRDSTALDPPSRQLLTDCEALAQQGVTELRTLAYLLHPPTLAVLGLLRGIHEYSLGFSQRSGLGVQFDLAADLGPLPDEVELSLFRVLQECLGNILRHADAHQVTVSLRRTSSWVTLEIRDDGRGMPLPKLSQAADTTTGVGISGMRERLLLLGGRLEIEPAHPGTRVRAILPVPGANP